MSRRHTLNLRPLNIHGGESNQAVKRPQTPPRLLSPIRKKLNALVSVEDLQRQQCDERRRKVESERDAEVQELKRLKQRQLDLTQRIAVLKAEMSDHLAKYDNLRGKRMNGVRDKLASSRGCYNTAQACLESVETELKTLPGTIASCENRVSECKKQYDKLIEEGVVEDGGWSVQKQQQDIDQLIACIAELKEKAQQMDNPEERNLYLQSLVDLLDKPEFKKARSILSITSAEDWLGKRCDWRAELEVSEDESGSEKEAGDPQCAGVLDTLMGLMYVSFGLNMVIDIQRILSLEHDPATRSARIASVGCGILRFLMLLVFLKLMPPSPRRGNELSNTAPVPSP